MTKGRAMTFSLSMPDGSALGLHVSRFDERQRRLRLRLPKAASCWDYAPLVDVVRREPGFGAHRFTGKTAAQWMEELRESRSADTVRFKQWYEAVINHYIQTLARRPRVPDNHYCIELAVLPWVSGLLAAINGLGLKKASVEQWLATLAGLAGKGTSKLISSLIRERQSAPTRYQCDRLAVFAMSLEGPRDAPPVGWCVKQLIQILKG